MSWVFPFLSAQTSSSHRPTAIQPSKTRPLDDRLTYQCLGTSVIAFHQIRLMKPADRAVAHVIGPSNIRQARRSQPAGLQSDEVFRWSGGSSVSNFLKVALNPLSSIGPRSQQ